MNISNLSKLVKVAICNPNSLLGGKNYIFIISHMRSYSSLLGHILGSHKEISGYSEMHQAYKGWLDLFYLRYKVYQANSNQLDGRFVLDKILHNYCNISDGILTHNNVYIVIMLRKPEESVRSIINMGKNIVDVDWFQDPEKVVDYYEKRLQQICIYAQRLKTNAIYFDAEKIIEAPEMVLDFLSDRFQLKEKLIPEYLTFKHTGSPDFGDPSDTIKQGKIVTKKDTHKDIQIQPELLDRARQAYANSREILLRYCDCI